MKMVAFVYSALFLVSVLGVDVEPPKCDGGMLCAKNADRVSASASAGANIHTVIKHNDGSVSGSCSGDTGGGAQGSCGGSVSGGGGETPHKGYFVGYSHKGVTGGGDICKLGCCSESFGYSHHGGGYYGCTCCATLAEAEAYLKARVEEAMKKN